MKYDCTTEFDLDIIYKKLTAPSATQMVKACNFFEQEDMLTLFQHRLEREAQLLTA